MIVFVDLLRGDRGIGGGLGDCEQVEVRVIALVKENHAVDLLGNDVPAVHGTRGGHDLRKDGVGGEDVAQAVNGIFLEVGIFFRSDVVKQLVLAAAQLCGCLGCQALVHVVVLVDMTAGHQIGGGRVVGLELEQLSVIEFLQQLPFRINRQRRIAVLAAILALAAETLATKLASGLSILSEILGVVATGASTATGSSTASAISGLGLLNLAFDYEKIDIEEWLRARLQKGNSVKMYLT